MGTPEFALPTLGKLVERYSVVGVVTQPDRPAGRGRHVEISPVKEMALAEGIPVYQPARLRKNVEAVEHIRAWAPDVAIVVAFGQILPRAVLEVPQHGVINVHASLLPRWRGAAPIQGALLAGDEVTGVTIMQLDEGMDTGPILAMRETGIGPEETAGDLESRLASLGADLLMEVLPAYIDGALAPCAQPVEGVTVTRPIQASQALLDWTAPAEALHNQVRAFSPTPGAYTSWNGLRLKVLRSRVAPAGVGIGAEPGAVMMWHELPVVATAAGCLVLVEVQIAGKRPMDGGAFVRGRKDFVGTTLDSPQPGESLN